MKLRIFAIAHKRTFLWYYLISIPFMVFIWTLDKDTKVAETVNNFALLSIRLGWALVYAVIPAYICMILYNLAATDNQSFNQNFLIALSVGLALSLILSFIGLLYILPVIFPLVLILLFVDKKHSDSFTSKKLPD